MVSYYPTLRDLVRVVPVAQSQTQGDTTLTFLSLDCYTDGWVANLRVHRLDPRYRPVFGFHPKPDLRRAQQFGGSGSFFSWHHREGDTNWYLSIIFFPALDPDETPLEFVVPLIHFVDRPTGFMATEVVGPWYFRVLPTGGIPAEVTPMNDTIKGSTGYGERIAKRQQETQSRYGPVFDDIIEILYRTDPMGIAWDNPIKGEEYYKEVRDIVERLPEAESAKDVQQIGVDVFHRWFGIAHREERWDKIGELIWQAWQQRQAEVSPQ